GEENHEHSVMNRAHEFIRFSRNDGEAFDFFAVRFAPHSHNPAKANALLSDLGEESEIGLAESSYVGKDRGEICTADAKPGCETSTVLIHSRGWYPSSACAASLIGVVRTIGG